MCTTLAHAFNTTVRLFDRKDFYECFVCLDSVDDFDINVFNKYAERGRTTI